MTETALALRDELRPMRRLAAIAGWGTAAGVALALFGGFAWMTRLGWLESPWWVLIAWVVTGLVTVGLAWMGWRWLSGLSPAWLADRLEVTAFRHGSVRGLLEPQQPGTSASLHAAADARQAESIRTGAAGSLNPITAQLRRHARRGLAVLGIGAVVLGFSQAGEGPSPLLWRPLEAAALLRAPIQLDVSATTVEPGATVGATIRAPGRRHAILWSRAPGETWRGEGLTLDSTGLGERTVGPLRSDLFLRVTSGGKQSDTLLLRVRMPAFVSDLQVKARYPRYLGLDDEPVATSGDTVIVPAGTRLEVRGTSTLPLAAASWRSGPVSTAMAVEGAEFQGRLEPRQSRTWTLSLAIADGTPVGGDTVRIPIVVVGDSLPTVQLPVPGDDTVLSAMPRVPLVISAEDDHGLLAMTLESRRITSLGQAGALRRDTIALPGDRDRQVVVPFELALGDRGLLPGDTLRVRVRVRDNSPAGQEAVSREYALRLASQAELREAARQTGDALKQRLAEVGEESRRLERQTEDLASEQVRRGGDEGSASGEQLSYQDTRRAEAVAESQAELMRQARELQDAVEQLQASARAAGLDDPEFQRRLEEVREQLARAMTPELRQRLAALQQALAQLDAEQTRKALEELADSQRQLREALERSRELFERAALEGDLARLEADVREMATEQRRWSDDVPRRDSLAAAREEAALADRADSAAAALQRAAEAAGKSQPDQQGGMQETAEALRDAARQMEQASSLARQGERTEAQRRGQQAADRLEPLGDQLSGQRQSLQQAWRQEVVDALDRVLADATRLSERELAITRGLQAEGNTASLRAEQGAVEEGVNRLLEQMQEISGKNALVPSQPSVALAAGRDAMRDVREALSSATSSARDATRRAADAVDALNSAALGLVRARGAVQGAASGSGMGEALEQLNQLAQQQGQLGQQAGGLIPLMGKGGEAEAQLRALAERQRSVAERLERMRAGGQIPGAAELAGEARDLARNMEAGRLNRQTVERQERLFRRMLDAGRTLQGDEQDEREERRSETARNTAPGTPLDAQIPAAGRGAIRIPSWEELRGLSPDERRRVVEYFRRLGDETTTGER